MHQRKLAEQQMKDVNAAFKIVGGSSMADADESLDHSGHFQTRRDSPHAWHMQAEQDVSRTMADVVLGLARQDATNVVEVAKSVDSWASNRIASGVWQVLKGANKNEDYKNGFKNT